MVTNQICRGYWAQEDLAIYVNFSRKFRINNLKSTFEGSQFVYVIIFDNFSNFHIF